MNELFDLLLEKPLAEHWTWPLLFVTFGVHLFLALLTVGTAVQATVYHLLARGGKRPWLTGWDKQIISHFFVYKSLAVVFGVAPLLLMQVSRTVPFVTATGLLAPVWMLIVVLLIAAFLLLESLSTDAPPSWRRLVFILLGLACLLIVPAIFAAVVVTTENPQQWSEISRKGFLPPAVLGHWFLRLLHVLGAAIVISSLFHYLRFSSRQPALSRHLLSWLMAALGFQAIFGLHLYSSVSPSPPLLATMLVIIGAIGAAATLALAVHALLRDRQMKTPAAALTLSFILLPMLLTRQVLQDRVLLPAEAQFSARAKQQRKVLEPYRPAALSSFEARNTVAYDHPATIYARSCSFCHGSVGNGKGEDAPYLVVPPEDLSAIRAKDAQVHKILLSGVPGTAMPPFGMYTRTQINGVIGFLKDQIGLADKPERTTASLTRDSVLHAQVTYANTCSTCHGPDGRITPLARKYTPPPPDLTVYTLSPQRAFKIISNGYPGTMMASYSKLPEDIRWGLVEVVHRFYK